MGVRGQGLWIRAFKAGHCPELTVEVKRQYPYKPVMVERCREFCEGFQGWEMLGDSGLRVKSGGTFSSEEHLERPPSKLMESKNELLKSDGSSPEFYSICVSCAYLRRAVFATTCLPRYLPDVVIQTHQLHAISSKKPLEDNSGQLTVQNSSFLNQSSEYHL